MTRLVFDKALCLDEDSLRDVILAFCEGLRAHTRLRRPLDRGTALASAENAGTSLMAG